MMSPGLTPALKSGRIPRRQWSRMTCRMVGPARPPGAIELVSTESPNFHTRPRKVCCRLGIEELPGVGDLAGDGGGGDGGRAGQVDLRVGALRAADPAVGVAGGGADADLLVEDDAGGLADRAARVLDLDPGREQV